MKRLAIYLFSLFACFAISFLLSGYILEFLKLPYRWAVGRLDEDNFLIATSVYDFAFAQVIVAMVSTLFFSIILLSVQIYRKTAPTLLDRKKGLFFYFLVLSPSAFVLGSIVGFFSLVPIVRSIFAFHWEGLGGFPSALHTALLLVDYLKLALSTILLTGIFFQFPVTGALFFFEHRAQRSHGAAL